MFCPKCGTQLNENASFCSKCGHPIQGTVTNNQPQQIYFKKPQRCLNCNQLHETPKMATINIVLIILGIIGICAFLPLGIALIVIGATIGRNNIPCPHCGCTPKQAKQKKAIDKVKKSPTKKFKPEQYNTFYKTLHTFNDQYKVKLICNIAIIILAILLLIPFICNVTIEYYIMDEVVREIEAPYIDIIANAEESFGVLLLFIWFIILCLAIMNIVLHKNFWVKLSLIITGAIHLLFNFILTEKFILDELLYTLIRDKELRELIESASSTVGEPRTALILIQIVVIVLVVAVHLISKADFLDMVVNSDNEVIE